MGVEEIRRRPGRFLLWRELIDSHGLHRCAGQQSAGTMLAEIQKHQRKRQIVIYGRNQSRSAGWKCGWMAPLAIGLIEDLPRPSLEICPIGRSEAVQLGSRHAEGRVLHLQRLEHSFS